MFGERFFRFKVSDEAMKLAEKYGYPPYFIERYMNIFESDELVEFLESIEKGLKKTIRCNTLRLKECSMLKDMLERKGYLLEKTPYFTYAYRVKGKAEGLGGTIEYLLGYYYIQGLGSMFAAELLSPSKDDIIADLAAAPGGKTTHIAQLMENRGCIIAVDKSGRRITKLVNNLRRMGVNNTIVVKADVLEIKGWERKYDKILLDAPCTGEGLIIFKRERRFSKTLADLERMSNVQYRMLLKALDMLKPGGLLLYSTCSIAPEENEYVISKVLHSRSDVKTVPTRFASAGSPGITHYMGVEFDESLSNCMRLYPHRDGTEGFFYCLIRRE